MSLKKICTECLRNKEPHTFTCTGSCGNIRRIYHNDHCYCLKHYKLYRLDDELQSKHNRGNCSIFDNETKLRFIFKLPRE